MWRRVPCQHQLNMGESGLSPRIKFLCPRCSQASKRTVLKKQSGSGEKEQLLRERESCFVKPARHSAWPIAGNVVTFAFDDRVLQVLTRPTMFYGECKKGQRWVPQLRE